MIGCFCKMDGHTQPNIDTDLITALERSQSPYENERRQAEDRLQLLENDDRFVEKIEAIAGNHHAPKSLRQMAVMSLKAYILRNWSPAFPAFDYDTSKLIKQETKENIRNFLLRLMGSTFRSLRFLAAGQIAKIAEIDLPDEWPDLIDNLLNSVRDGNEQLQHGALETLKDIVDGALTDTLFFRYAAQLLETLYSVASSKVWSESSFIQKLGANENNIGHTVLLPFPIADDFSLLHRDTRVPG